jgi:Cu(I)/Ag(I) efflux system membrane protein CusA/SilA
MDWNLKLAIESVPGVSQVASIGGFVKQYQITFDPNRLTAYNIPITKVMESVRRSNLDVEGRVIEFSGIEYMVRGRGYIKTMADLRILLLQQWLRHSNLSERHCPNPAWSGD